MLQLDNVRIIKEHQVHGDDVDPAVFYVLPRFPRIARLENGGLALRFAEYSALREQDGNLFAGFVAIDVDLAIPEETLETITTTLQQQLDQRFPGQQAPRVTIAPVPWLGGSVQLLLEENGVVVERIATGPGPALAGNNVACFLVELTQLGTAIFKDTLSAGVSSGIQVVYTLEYYARLPKMHAEGRWHASEFYRFIQDVDVDDSFWFWNADSYTEMVSSSRWKSDVTTTSFNFIGNPDMTPEQQIEFESQIRNAINAQLAEAVKRNLMQAITDVDPDVKNLTEEQDFEDVRRTISRTQVTDVVVKWDEAKAIITEYEPQGSLPTVTSLEDADGNALVWDDYYSKISLDEFLRTLPVNIRVNAPFEDLPIHSVEVKVRYPHGPNAKTVEKTLTSADDVEKVEFLAHDGIRKYWRSYTVNFENSSFVFQSDETEVDDTDLTINVDDLGVLALDVVDGDINFSQVTRANVRLRYAGTPPIERSVNLTAAEKEVKIREVLQGPRTKPVDYQVTYTMAGPEGREVRGPAMQAGGRLLAVDDPFRALRTVTFRATGNLDTDVRDIAIQATYVEGGGEYRLTHPVTLSKAMPFADWTFPVIDESAGVLSYLATINRFDGTTQDVDEPAVKGSIIAPGPKVADFLEIDVVPDLVDWAKVRMVNVALSYDDGSDTHTENLLFRPGDAMKSWKVPVKDKSRKDYMSTVTYFTVAGGREKVGPKPETDTSLFLELV